MNISDPTGTDWSESEIDLIIADYFDMLRTDLAGEPYVKSHRNAELQKLTGRSHGSIEYKHQNISAVLAKLCRPWIPGYKPKANFQKALLDGVDRYLSTHDLLTNLQPGPRTELAEEQSLILESPPILRADESDDPLELKRLIRKFDVAESDARNRSLGKQGEERIMQFELSRLRQAGRDDLARKVKWVSQTEGDAAGYDILSFSSSGEPRLLEVKTTTGHQRTPFYLSENERALSSERPEEFRLVRLYDFLRVPKAFKLVPPLEESVILRPNSYRASFGN